MLFAMFAIVLGSGIGVVKFFNDICGDEPVMNMSGYNVNW